MKTLLLTLLMSTTLLGYNLSAYAEDRDCDRCKYNKHFRSYEMLNHRPSARDNEKALHGENVKARDVKNIPARVRKNSNSRHFKNQLPRSRKNETAIHGRNIEPK